LVDFIEPALEIDFRPGIDVVEWMLAIDFRPGIYLLDDEVCFDLDLWRDILLDYLYF